MLIQLSYKVPCISIQMRENKSQNRLLWMQVKRTGGNNLKICTKNLKKVLLLSVNIAIMSIQKTEGLP